MENQAKRDTPAGYSAVCPYLMVKDVKAELTFLQKVFSAEIKEQLLSAEGEVMHAEAKIGDTIIMMGKVSGEGQQMKCMNYVFVQDVDTTYRVALENGAAAIMEPSDQYYGHRDGGVEDPQGIQWWIGQQIEELTSEEIQTRMRQQNAR